MLDIRRIFEKIFTIVGIVFLFHHVIWLNIGNKSLFIVKKYYFDFWDFIRRGELITILFFLGSVVLVIIFLVPLIFSDYEEVEEGPSKKEDPL